MAGEEKGKKKIDLKARLGKPPTGVGPAVPLPVPGASQPPPSGPGGGSVPAPNIAPPTGLSPGIPAPAFARPVQAAPQPKPSPAQQTIKVEVSEEVEREHKKMQKRAALYAGIAGVVALAIGFGIGGAKERSDRGKAAQAGAGALEKDVKAANDKMSELRQKLEDAGNSFGDKKFPDDLATSLGSINIPFDSTNLEGKQTGNLPAKAQRAILNYTSAVQDLNKRKESLKNLLGIAKPTVEKTWKEAASPVFGFSVVFRADQKGMVAELLQNKDTFEVGKDWPANYTIFKPERTQQGVKNVEKKATRWTKGDLTGSDPVAIPVDPPSVAAFTGEKVVFELAKAIRDIRIDLEGDKSNPANEIPGLIKDGEALAEELRKIANAK